MFSIKIMIQSCLNFLQNKSEYSVDKATHFVKSCFRPQLSNNKEYVKGNLNTT